jgi:carbonic anhydrase
VESHKKLLLSNKAWAHEKVERSASYFKELAKDQSPEFLWVGCSDSRVPAEEVTGTEPGQIFVHRNIANLIIHADFNLLSVLQYAVQSLKVKHIIVCGHYGCGGVRAAISRETFGPLNKWIHYIKEVAYKRQSELAGLGEAELFKKLVELNVEEQVKNLSRTATIQSAWKNTQAPLIHGWVFNLEDGLLTERITMGPDSPVDDPFRFKL